MADQYDALLKAQLQRLAKRRDIDPNQRADELREALRAQDEADTPVEDDEEGAQDDDEDDADLEDEEDDEEDDGIEDEEDDEEDEPASGGPQAQSTETDELRTDYYRHSVVCGNGAFFEDPLWNAANEEMALLQAGNAGYRYAPDQGRMERVVDGNTVHYQFPVERVG